MSTRKTTAQKIGEYVKYQRQKHHWSLQDFADLCELTPSFLLRLEQGEYETVKFEVVEKLAKGFHMSLFNFLQKCELIGNNLIIDLPEIEFYLKEKFQLPVEAIEDVKLFLEVIHKKYEKQIAEMKAAHERYWKEGKK